MKLLKRDVVGTGVHRSGWPRVVQALRELASGDGMLLDDFADASFSYQSLREPHRQTWVGVFHNPVRVVASPLKSDAKHELRRISGHRYWKASRLNLRGAIALCEEVAADLRRWLGVPALSIWHPTETDAPRWNADVALAKRRLVQAGAYLRNTQIIFQFDAPHWQRVQLFGASPWHRKRDESLRRCRARPDVRRNEVERIHQRLDDAAYDQVLAESVIVTELYGAAANNLIVECMARGTPIVVNRLPAVEEYLGRDYPLFFSDASEIPGLMQPSRLCEASAYLLDRSQRLPTFDQFALTIRQFVDSLSTASRETA